MLPIYTYVIIYAITIIVGLFTYSKYAHNNALKLFLVFLIYSLFTELIGAYVGRILVVNTNYIYNSWNIASFLFYAFFILTKIKDKRKQLYIKFLLVLFISFTVINITFFTSFTKQILINNTLLAKSLIVICVIIYFIELLKSNEILNFKKSLFFWICLGAFLYNLVFIPAFALVKYTSFFGAFKYITFGLNIIANLCFITGFIISKKEYN